MLLVCQRMRAKWCVAWPCCRRAAARVAMASSAGTCPAQGQVIVRGAPATHRRPSLQHVAMVHRTGLVPIKEVGPRVCLCVCVLWSVGTEAWRHAGQRPNRGVVAAPAVSTGTPETSKLGCTLFAKHEM